MFRRFASFSILLLCLLLTPSALAQTAQPTCAPTDPPSGCAVVTLPAGLSGDYYLGDQLVATQQNAAAITVPPSANTRIDVRNITSTEAGFSSLFIYKDANVTANAGAGQSRTYPARPQKQYIRGTLEVKCDIKSAAPTDAIACAVSIDGTPREGTIAPAAKAQYILDPGPHTVTVTLVGEHAAIWSPASAEQRAQITAGSSVRPLTFTFNKQALLTLALDQVNVLADYYVDGQLVAAQVPSFTLYVAPNKSHRIDAKNITDAAAGGLYRWKDATGSVYLGPAAVRTNTFRLQKEWLMGFLEITCKLTNVPPEGYCQPNIDGADVAPIAQNAVGRYVLTPGQHTVVVNIGPLGQWPAAPFTNRPSIRAGQTARLTAQIRYTAPPTPTPMPTAPGPVCDCSGNIYNCSDFPLPGGVRADQCYQYCIAQGRGDIHGLDRDNDGDACEAGY